ncbi:hypothetical protein K8T06_00465 [bacterium]|nr:hypothetical protein [bacterium]
MTPNDENLVDDEAEIVDASGHTDAEKLVLYQELEALAIALANKFTTTIGWNNGK